MEEEYSKQEEARRILEALRQKEEADGEGAGPSEKEFARLPSEEAAKLEAFINTTIQAKAPPPPVEEEVSEPVEIDPISTEQIKVMRKYAANKVETKEPLKKTLSEFVIRSYFEMLAYLSPQNRAQKCREDGHHVCVNCGVKIPLPSAKSDGEEESAATGPASSNPAAH